MIKALRCIRSTVSKSATGRDIATETTLWEHKFRAIPVDALTNVKQTMVDFKTSSLTEKRFVIGTGNTRLDIAEGDTIAEISNGAEVQRYRVVGVNRWETLLEFLIDAIITPT